MNLAEKLNKTLKKHTNLIGIWDSNIAGTYFILKIKNNSLSNQLKIKSILSNSKHLSECDIAYDFESREIEISQNEDK